MPIRRTIMSTQRHARRLITIALALGTVSAVGCSLDSSGGCRGTQWIPDLVGTWAWVKSSGTFAGATWTPESTGRSESLVVSDNCTLTRFESGIEVERSVFGVRANRDTTLYFSNRDMFPFGEQWLRMKTRDELILADKCSDCVARFFVRSNYRN